MSKKALILLAISLLKTSLLLAENISLPPERLKFSYQGYDGELVLRCTHKLENEFSQDWGVFCSNDIIKREYSVHLWVTRYTKKVAPKSSFEILYWVKESFPTSNSYSTTNWIHLIEESKFFAAQFSVGVDNDSAGLYLEILP